MPRFTFTNEVSMVDLILIGGLLASGAAFFFGYGADIQTNSTRIANIETEIVRIEQRSERKDQEIIDTLRQNRTELKEYRDEARENNREVNRKLDKLIERELDGR